MRVSAETLYVMPIPPPIYRWTLSFLRPDFICPYRRGGGRASSIPQYEVYGGVQDAHAWDYRTL